MAELKRRRPSVDDLIQNNHDARLLNEWMNLSDDGTQLPVQQTPVEDNPAQEAPEVRNDDKPESDPSD